MTITITIQGVLMTIGVIAIILFLGNVACKMLGIGDD
jgi:hypothetical protein